MKSRVYRNPSGTASSNRGPATPQCGTGADGPLSSHPTDDFPATGARQRPVPWPDILADSDKPERFRLGRTDNYWASKGRTKSEIDV